MKQWVDQSCTSFLNSSEKDTAMHTHFHWRRSEKKYYPLKKVDSEPNFATWEVPELVIEQQQTAHVDARLKGIPSIETLQEFSEKFKMPEKWEKVVSEEGSTVGDEMKTYQARGKGEATAAEGEKEYLTFLKGTLGLEKMDPGSPNTGNLRRGRSGSTVHLPRKVREDIKADSAAREEYKEDLGKDGVRLIKYGTLGQILRHLVEFLTHADEAQKSAGSKMFLAFIHSYRRIETSQHVLEWVSAEYFDSMEEPPPDGVVVTKPKKAKSGRRYSSTSLDCKTESLKRKQGILGFVCLWLEHRFVPDFTTPYVDGQSKKTPLYGEFLQFFSKMQPGHQNVVKVVLDQETQESIGEQHSASKLLGLSRIRGSSKSGDSDALNPHKMAKSKGRRGTLTKNTSRFFSVMSQRSQSLPRHFTCLDLQAEEISELLTKEDSRLFTNVNVDEFSGKAWTPALDSGIGVMTHRWNKLGRWVASEVVNNANLKQRVEILKRFANVLESVFKNNNFFTSMAIISGLNHSAVQRMKKTWKALPEKYQKELSHIEEELSFSSSFRRYRELLSDALEKGKPCIPFLAVHTKDLLFMNDAKGNPDWVGEGVINFEKLNLIGNIVAQMKHCQKMQSKYEVIVLNPQRHEMLTNFIGRLPNTLPEESLYPTSLTNEPSQDV